MPYPIRPRAVSREEQIELAARAKQGDEDATLRLMESCAAWVYREAARTYRRLSSYQRPRLDQDDLVQEGFLGILRALRKYDPSRGRGFLTYAAWWIRQGIQRAIHADAEVPSHLWHVIGKVRAALVRRGLEPYEVDPKTVVQLEPTLRLSDVEGVWHALVLPLSLDLEVDLGDYPALLAEIIPDPAPERLAPIAPEVLVGLRIVEEHSHPHAKAELRGTLDLEGDGWLGQLYAWHVRLQVRRRLLAAATAV